MSAYEVLYARQFHEQLMVLPDSVYERVEHSVDVVADNPGLLRVYDPPYEAAVPPLDLRWYYVPHTHKVIYLEQDEQARQLRPLFLGDTREDPRHRFDRMDSVE
ncbi:MAG: hypothetical protein SOI26_10300 [Coriobacteriales bacterium]|jgi:hypothetical protein